MLVTTIPGDTVKVVGNTGRLGDWAPGDGVPLAADGYEAGYPRWSGAVGLDAGLGFEYKFVRVAGDGAVVWEGGANRGYTLSAGCGGSVDLDDAYWQ